MICGEFVDSTQQFHDIKFFRINDMTPLRSFVRSWIQKTAGILLMHQNDQKPRKLILKEAHDTKIEEIEIVPIFPDCITISKS